MQDAPPLDDTSVEIIERHFQAMLLEVENASMKTIPANYEPNEAEARHNWDRLFLLFYADTDELTSPYVV